MNIFLICSLSLSADLNWFAQKHMKRGCRNETSVWPQRLIVNEWVLLYVLCSLSLMFFERECARIITVLILCSVCMYVLCLGWVFGLLVCVQWTMILNLIISHRNKRLFCSMMSSALIDIWHSIVFYMKFRIPWWYVLTQTSLDTKIDYKALLGSLVNETSSWFMYFPWSTPQQNKFRHWSQILLQFHYLFSFSLSPFWIDVRIITVLRIYEFWLCV